MSEDTKMGNVENVVTGLIDSRYNSALDFTFGYLFVSAVSLNDIFYLDSIVSTLPTIIVFGSIIGLVLYGLPVFDFFLYIAFPIWLRTKYVNERTNSELYSDHRPRIKEYERYYVHRPRITELINDPIIRNDKTRVNIPIYLTILSVIILINGILEQNYIFIVVGLLGLIAFIFAARNSLHNVCSTSFLLINQVNLKGDWYIQKEDTSVDELIKELDQNIKTNRQQLAFKTVELIEDKLPITYFKRLTSFLEDLKNWNWNDDTGFKLPFNSRNLLIGLSSSFIEEKQRLTVLKDFCAFFDFYQSLEYKLKNKDKEIIDKLKNEYITKMIELKVKFEGNVKEITESWRAKTFQDYEAKSNQIRYRREGF